MHEWDGEQAPAGRWSYGILAVAYVVTLLVLVGGMTWVIADVIRAL